ncbi:Voltage-gated Ion Channel (VIC) Superfamily [Achlya hypogyna]|uniref:Voltage-gated Ion Channel (VIC) Superfamily n=1 Tax=Achlya hypogyna TaxID=1202772 RepID=A0A1V9ZMP9_ACHHY|nr:Voltage-gated Ion Channel (VIC) Superfamily [Achlya hypogyna]
MQPEKDAVVAPADVVVATLAKDIAQIAEERDEDNALSEPSVVARSSGSLSWRARFRPIIFGVRIHRRPWLMSYHYSVLAVIVFDVAMLMAETLDGPNCAGSAPDYPTFPTYTFYEGIEVLVTLVLSVDLVLKCVLARDLKFFRSFGFALDGLSTASLYLLVLKIGNPMQVDLKRNTTVAAIKAIRYFRLPRIMFMMKDMDGMVVLHKTAMASVPPLKVTLFFLITIVMMFATMLYYAQPCYNVATCTFTDIFNAGYFVMVTVATVGYGDQVPDLNNILALVITCIVMIFGTLYLAMPLAIIGIHYETTWIDFDAKQVELGLKSQAVQSNVEAEAATFERMETMDLSATHHSLNAKFLDMCDIVTRIAEHADALVASLDAQGIGPVDWDKNGKVLEIIRETTHAIKVHRALTKEIKPFVPKDLVTSQSGKKPMAAANRTTSFSHSIVSRAKRALSNIKPKDDDGPPDPSVKRTVRERLFLLMERPHSSRQANLVNKFFLLMVILSVLMFYAETTPELQHYGMDSDLCHDAFASYCASRDDVGCFVRSATNETTTKPLDFYCDADASNPDCFGVGYNYGSNATLPHCYSLFSNPTRICEIRQCKPGHVPMFDMTLKWVYLEYYFGAVFTCEMALRLYAARNRGAYLRSVGTYIDVVAVTPFYAEVIQGIVNGRVPMYAIVPTFPTFLSVLPVMKPMRILKLARHFKSTSVLARTTRETWKRLLIPLFFLFLGCVSAGAIFYEIERGTSCYKGYPCMWWDRNLWTKELEGTLPFGKMEQIQVNKFSIITDMLRSSWLSIETFTTVGYGDMHPRTPFGRLLDIIAMVLGSFYTAMPLSLVGTQFYLAYRDFLETQKNKRLNGSLSLVRPRNASTSPRRPLRKRASVISQDDVPVLNQFMTLSRLLNETLQMVYRLNAAQPRPAKLGAQEVPMPPLLQSVLGGVKTARNAGRRSFSPQSPPPPTAPVNVSAQAKAIHIEGMSKGLMTATALSHTILLQFSIIVHKIVVSDPSAVADSPARVTSSQFSRSENSRRDSNSDSHCDDSAY